MSDVSSALDERVLAAWDGVLGAPGTRTIERMPYGRAWWIATAARHLFVLKQLGDTHLAARRHRFAAETRIVIHLAGYGVPVGVPVPSDDGRICIEHDDALWALTPMLPMPEAVELPTAETVV